MNTLRPYQAELATNACQTIKRHGLAYIAAEMRVGKTLIALETARLLNAKQVAFITKLKATYSVIDNYNDFGYSDHYDMLTINYESIHKIEEYVRNSEFIILDEAHGLGQFPKPAGKTRELKDLLKSKPILFLSGTPSPESYSQLYHQLSVSSHSPWKNYRNFYGWAKDYVTIKQRKVNGYLINDYSNANKDRIFEDTKHLFISFTQEQAGFTISELTEQDIQIPMSAKTSAYIDQLKKYRIAHVEDINDKSVHTLICDTASSFRQKVHQLSSGTVITNEGEAIQTDRSKAEYIRDFFQGAKVAVFYQFAEERELLVSTLDVTTTDPKVFAESKDVIYISQIQAGSQGVDLSTADALVFYNVNFSAMHYLQARARLQTMTRTNEAKIYYLCGSDGIEQRILNMVRKKEDYTLAHFMRDYR